jgi:WD40 repeat protein
LLSCAGLLVGVVLAVGLFTTASPDSLSPKKVSLHGQGTLVLPEQNDILGFSPDRKTLLTAREGAFGRRRGPLRLWDIRAGKERFAVAGDWKGIETVLFSPDGKLLAAHELEGDLKVWDAGTGKELAAVPAPTKFTNWVNFRFTPDGRMLAIQDYTRGWPDKDFVRLWDVRARRDVGFIEGYFWAMAISPGSRTAATYTRKDRGQVDRVMLWGLAGVKPGDKLKETKVSADEVAFSPDLATFATSKRSAVPGGPTEIAIWDTRSGAMRVSFLYDEEGDTHIQQLEFLAGGKVLWASGGGGTQLSWQTKDTLWDVTSAPRRIGTFPVRPALSPDGKYVALPKDNGADLHLAEGMEKRGDLTHAGDIGPSFSFNNIKVYPSVQFSADGRLAAVTGLHPDPIRGGGVYGPVARLWQTGIGRELLSIPGCRQVVFSPDGKTLATLEGNVVRLRRLSP